MSGESEKTLRDTFDEAKVCHVRRLIDSEGADKIETGTMYLVFG